MTIFSYCNENKKFCAAKNRRLEFPSLGCEDLNIEEEEKGGKVIFCLTFFFRNEASLYRVCKNAFFPFCF